MRRIHKVQLKPETRQIVMLDPAAWPLSVGVQNEHPVMWYSTPWPVSATPVARVFRVITTGEEYEPEDKLYIGTVTIKDWYVAHVFEIHGPSSDPIDPRRTQDLIDLAEELDNVAR